MGRDRPGRAKVKTVRAAMLAIALIATPLGLLVNESWRWGYPRHVRFDGWNALRLLGTVIQEDFRMYDGTDVDALLSYVARERLLIGKSKAEILGLLGQPDADGERDPLPLWADKGEILYVVGRVSPTWRAHPPTLLCHFGLDGKCDKLSLSVSD